MDKFTEYLKSNNINYTDIQYASIPTLNNILDNANLTLFEKAIIENTMFINKNKYIEDNNNNKAIINEPNFLLSEARKLKHN